MVMVEHRGGSSQRYSMVLAADATLIPKADLTTFSNSILPSSTTPLVGDLVAISLAWHNQGTLASGAYRIQLEDITEGTILYDSNRSSLDGGELDSVSFFAQFATTGIHTLRLSLDTSNQVVEINDGVSGTNNNVLEMDIEVTAQGLRVIFLEDDGTYLKHLLHVKRRKCRWMFVMKQVCRYRLLLSMRVLVSARSV